MLNTFIKLIKVEDNKFKYIFDPFKYSLEDIKDQHSKNVNVAFILHTIDVFKNDYYTNLSKLLTDKSFPNTITNVIDLISQAFNDAVIFAYETNFIRNINQYVKFISSDWYDNFEFASFNPTTSITSGSISVSSYPDLLIKCNSSLNKKIVLGNDIMYHTKWHNGGAVVKGSKDPYLKKQRIGFLDLSYSDDVVIKTFAEMDDNGLYKIPTELLEGYDFFICVNGKPIFFKGGLYYRTKTHITINWGHLSTLELFKKLGLSILEENINSFVCFVKCKKLVYRTLHLINDIDNLHRIYFDHKESDDSLIQYMCYDIYNFGLYAMTMPKEKFFNPMHNINPMYNVYIEDFDKQIPIDKKRHSLLQMLIQK